MQLLVVKNSLGKYFFYGSLTLILAVLGYFILKIGNDSQSTLVGWSSIIGFGLSSLVFWKRFLDRRPRIIFDESGIFDRRQKIALIEWQDIEQACLYTKTKNNFISVVLRNPDKYSRKRFRPLGRLARHNQSMGLATISISLNGTDIHHEEIFDVFIRQLTKVRIKNLNSLATTLDSSQKNIGKSVSTRSK